MIHARQLEYFVTCAELGSFSEAANVLYTTQPNISKVIKSLESELDTELFFRGNRGISLTESGKEIYECAKQIMANIEQMHILSKNKHESVLSVSYTPWRWFSSLFVDYYKKNTSPDITYNIVSAQLDEIITRINLRQDDIGFVLVEQDNMNVFEYMLRENNLNFVCLTEMKYVLNPKSYRFIGDLSELDNREVDMVEYCGRENTEKNFRKSLAKGGIRTDFRRAVVTNSGYIYEKLLRQTELISIDYNNVEAGETADIVFGYVKPADSSLSAVAADFVEFVRSRTGKIV